MRVCVCMCVCVCVCVCVRARSLCCATGFLISCAFCVLDAHRALELLEEYRKRLAGTDNQPLRDALTKAIVAIRSKLFQALLGKRGGKLVKGRLKGGTLFRGMLRMKLLGG